MNNKISDPIAATFLRCKTILLFDGECMMCDSLVQFIIRVDKKEHFYFAALQSEVGQALLADYDLDSSSIDSFVSIDYQGALLKSSAALTVFRKLGGMWQVLYAGKIIPEGIRDWLYLQIAKRRYTWFGKKELCLLPSIEQKRRFLSSKSELKQLL